MKQLEEKTLEEIIFDNNPQELEEYYKELKGLKTNRITRSIVESLEGKPLEYIWEKVYTEEQKITSTLFFPDDLVLLYPNIKERHAKNFITCNFSGALIYPGSLYINYRPLVENITTKEKYVLKRTLKVEPGYIYDLPTTITELEELQNNILLESDDYSDGIDYSHLSQSIGGELVLQKLNRRR